MSYVAPFHGKPSTTDGKLTSPMEAPQIHLSASWTTGRQHQILIVVVLLSSEERRFASAGGVSLSQAI